MKKSFLFLTFVLLTALACDLSVTTVPSTSPAPLSTNTQIQGETVPTAVPPTVVPNPTHTAEQPSNEGAEVFYGPVTLVLPPGLASGIRGSQFSRSEGTDVAPWDKTPGNIQIDLDGYLIQGKFHEPRIRVYPATAYGEMDPGAFESLHRLNNILGGLPVSSDQLPIIPFFNAQQVFASNIQMLSFQNGRGVRFLTEYGQFPVSANNTDLFYNFHGMTTDGAYYIIAILPVTAPVLAETSDGGAVLPPGGIPYPYFADPEADMHAYYSAVTALLDSTPAEAFSPTIGQLDRLIQSMQVTP